MEGRLRASLFCPSTAPERHSRDWMPFPFSSGKMKRRQLFEQEKRSPRKKAGEPAEGAQGLRSHPLYWVPRNEPAPDALSVRLCGGHSLDKGQRGNERCLHPDPRHLHHRGHCYCCCGSADDELLPLRADSGRIPGLAEAHRHHLDHPELPGLHHELHYPVLLRRTVYTVRPYGYLRRHCGMDRRTNHVWPGLD